MESLAAHRTIRDCIEQRKPTADLPHERVALLAFLKLVEELGEVAQHLDTPISGEVARLGELARAAFRDRGNWVREAGPLPDFAALRAELADVYAALVVTTREVVAAEGREWDITAAAVAKARADVGRA